MEREYKTPEAQRMHLRNWQNKKKQDPEWVAVENARKKKWCEENRERYLELMRANYHRRAAEKRARQTHPHVEA